MALPDLEAGWTRLEFLLPINDDAERQAAQNVMDAIRNVYWGATNTIDDPVTLQGYWVDEDTGTPYWDKVKLMFLDLNFDVSHTRIKRACAIIEITTHTEYLAAGSPQLAIYISAHSLFRWPQIT